MPCDKRDQAPVWREERTGLLDLRKLITFAAAEDHPEFAKELPRFLAAVWRVFNEYEIA